MRSFGEHVRRGHLCWGEGDVEHHLSEEHLPHLVSMPVSDGNSLEEHAPSPAALRAHKRHQSRLSPDARRGSVDYKKHSGDLNDALRHSTLEDGKRHIRSKYFTDSDYASSPPGSAVRLDVDRRFDTVQSHAARMDAVTSNPSPEVMHVYRGIEHHRNMNIAKMPVGHEFTDHGYTGTSLKPEIALKFGWFHHIDSIDSETPASLTHHRTMAKIHVPKGTKGHYLDVGADGPLSHEHEYTLRRGTRFRITGHERTQHEGSPVHLVHMKVVGQNEPEELVNGHAHAMEQNKSHVQDLINGLKAMGK